MRNPELVNSCHITTQFPRNPLSAPWNIKLGKRILKKCGSCSHKNSVTSYKRQTTNNVWRNTTYLFWKPNKTHKQNWKATKTSHSVKQLTLISSLYIPFIFPQKDRAQSALFLISILCCSMYCLCRMRCSMYCWCVNVYSTTATGWQPNYS